MSRPHHYTATTVWTGNRGTGTIDYKAYDRNHTIAVDGKQILQCSADPAFRGDKSKHNPEELLLASLSGCHMLWYLHLAAVKGVIVTAYIDHAEGIMAENVDGSGQFTTVTLHPEVTVQDEHMVEKAQALHHAANSMCFIARSVNFPVHHKPAIFVAGKPRF